MAFCGTCGSPLIADTPRLPVGGGNQSQTRRAPRFVLLGLGVACLLVIAVLVATHNSGGGSAPDHQAVSVSRHTTTTASPVQRCFDEVASYLDAHADDSPFIPGTWAEWGRGDPRAQVAVTGYYALRKNVYEVGRDRAWKAAYKAIQTACDENINGVYEPD